MPKMGSTICRIVVRLHIVVVLATFLFGITPQANAVPSAEAEIIYLLSYLERSDCKFNRNGSWYTASEARAHLEMKYRYLVDQESISTTEDFIDQAATASSMSGMIYRVKCEGAEEIPSAVLLKKELQRLRQAAAIRKP